MKRLEAVTVEIGLAKDYGERARLMLSELGILLKPASFRDIYQIASRDTAGHVPNYDVNFSGEGRGWKPWLIKANGVVIGYYATDVFTDRGNGDLVGEVRTIRLSPALRGREIGSFFFFLGRIELLEEGVDTLRSVVSDETGKIVGLLKKSGFVKTNKTVEASGCPVWEMKDLDKKREQILDFFFQQFCKRIKKIKPADLIFDPKDVEIDNPLRVSVKNTVLDRLGENGGYFAGVSRFVFGYHFAPVSIVQQNLKDGQTRFVLQVEGRNESDKDILRAILSEPLPGQQAEIISSYPLSDESWPRWEVESHPLKGKEKIRESAQKLAMVGGAFFNRVRVRQKEVSER